jgi:hypothetical protein
MQISIGNTKQGRTHLIIAAAVIGWLAFLAWVFSIDTSDRSAPAEEPVVTAVEEVEDQACPETVISDYYEPWRASLKEFRETHDLGNTYSSDWGEYVALKNAMYEGAEEYYNAQGCKTVSGIVIR